MNQLLLENEAEQFSQIAQVENAFRQGKIPPKQGSINVAGVIYRFAESAKHTWDEIISQQRRAMTIYTVHPNENNMKKFEEVKGDVSEDTTRHQNTIVMLWALDRQSRIVPTAARFTTRARSTQIGVAGLKEGTDISYEEDIVISNINDNQPFKCKIDTGADMCSLHAEDIQVNGDTVVFSINNKRYRMPVAGSQTVKQADSDHETRPTVKFNVVLAGQTINGVECNLNDRTGMSAMLIGKNLLSQHDFTINTKGLDDGMDESVSDDEWLEFESLFEGVEPPTPQRIIDTQEVDKVIATMLESDCSLKDVIHTIKERSLNTLNEDIRY